jgi:hypothetical protein
MSSSELIRWSGLAAIVGGTVYVSLGLLGRLYIYLYSPSDPSGVPPVLNYVERVFPIVLLSGAAAAIAGLHWVQRESYGLVGTLVSLTAFVGVVLLLVGSVVARGSGGSRPPSPPASSSRGRWPPTALPHARQCCACAFGG